MKKRILILAMTVFTLGVMTLPMIPAAHAYGWEKSENTYAASVNGMIVADEGEVDFWETRNWYFGKYTAHSEIGGIDLLRISWDDEVLEGTEVLHVSYRINKDTMEGIVRFKVEITFEDGKFKGHMQWVGDLVKLPDNTVMPKFSGGSWAWYTYWQGTGAYAGWKLTQRFGPAVAEPLSGLLLIR
jgi:hypothetical protein